MTANELFKHYQGMTYEEREKFLSTFKQLYDAHHLASKPMNLGTRSRLREQLDKEQYLND